MRREFKELEDQEIPMGPMIDMVFLLLIFFMVTAKPIQPEADINISLPGTVPQDRPVEIPDEQQIEIRADGQVVLNEMVVAEPADREMPLLRSILQRFHEAARVNQAQAIVTLVPDDASVHQRIVDVLNVCAAAGLTGVTFAGAAEGGL